jgi:hypothetical protein
MKNAGSGQAEPSAVGVAAALGRITAAVDHARGPSSVASRAARPGQGEAGGSGEFLAALALLRELRGLIAGWEPDLIDAARHGGASWAEIAPALGVASRQAAERRYLRLRPATDDGPSTGDERVQAERDRRAGERAVRLWARDNAAELRQLAGQISALDDLPAAADGGLAALRRALGTDDAADLLAPLADAHEHLESGHSALAARVRGVARDTASVRQDSRTRRRGPHAAQS